MILDAESDQRDSLLADEPQAICLVRLDLDDMRQAAGTRRIARLCGATLAVDQKGVCFTAPDKRVG